jgi:hypothetical protein
VSDLHRLSGEIDYRRSSTQTTGKIFEPICSEKEKFKEKAIKAKSRLVVPELTSSFNATGA